jgi:hypothetical protein
MSDAAKLVSDSIVGTDVRVVVVNSKRYVIHPPTIYRIAGAISCLSGMSMKDAPTTREILLSMGPDSDLCARALSWFVNGDEGLSDEFRQGTLEEVVNGLDEAVSLIPAKVFSNAVSLAVSVSALAARQKPEGTTHCWDK